MIRRQWAMESAGREFRSGEEARGRLAPRLKMLDTVAEEW
jgi:hypothetical protein